MENYYEELYRHAIEEFDKLGWSLVEMHVKHTDYPVSVELFRLTVLIDKQEFYVEVPNVSAGYSRSEGEESRFVKMFAYSVVDYIIGEEL